MKIILKKHFTLQSQIYYQCCLSMHLINKNTKQYIFAAVQSTACPALLDKRSRETRLEPKAIC